MAKRIHHLYSENPYAKMWDTYVYFESEPTTKAFLEDNYEKKGIEDSHKFAFHNTSKFIYFIKQAREYFEAAKKSHILVKPLLVYYGMMSLVKPVVLTMDPHYPSNTGVLRHGVTTRKIKKLDYVFHDDEIRIQKEGLLPHFYSLLLKEKQIPQLKYKVKDLLALVPELHETFFRLYNQIPTEPLYIASEKDHESGNTLIYLSERMLKRLDKSAEELVRWINTYNEGKGRFENGSKRHRDYIQVQWNHPDKMHVFDCPDGFANALFRQDYKGRHYLYHATSPDLLLPEVIIHFLLMYNLGMLCRYETELWGEIIFSFSSADMFMINELLNISMRKFPNLILNLLLDEILIFNNV
jgi:hypothetical protein